jgi:hypothetical protein
MERRVNNKWDLQHNSTTTEKDTNVTTANKLGGKCHHGQQIKTFLPKNTIYMCVMFSASLLSVLAITTVFTYDNNSRLLLAALQSWLHKNPRRAVVLVVLRIPAWKSTLGTQNCHIRIKQLDILSIRHITSTFVSQQCKEIKQIFSSCPQSSYKRSHKSWKAVHDQFSFLLRRCVMHTSHQTFMSQHYKELKQKLSYHGIRE